ncbi:RidA family protein [Cognatiyoonia sp. IB215446]|uniref:RidA family protein n=1 Tax=Cognatiyoonia sp. IB215446 TaxID=3097355 RepID=UPI002A13FA46|nr:RidA family protein [Cognatiyoonia sp. IB215446]MDX8349752.1 RidA family protein [Cognatiyoonia sp. IB215446]
MNQPFSQLATIDRLRKENHASIFWRIFRGIKLKWVVNMPDTLTRINPSTLPDTGSLGYSQISVADAGALAFVSGQVGADAKTSEVPEGLELQIKQVIENLNAALHAINAGPEDIVQLRVYMIDLNQDSMAIAMPPLMRFLNGARPSLTGVGVAGLAGADLKVEIEMVVQVPVKSS